MILSKSRALTGFGALGFLVAFGAGACSSKSDSGGSAGVAGQGGALGGGAGASGKGGNQSVAGANQGGSESAGAAGDAAGGESNEAGAAGAETGGVVGNGGTGGAGGKGATGGSGGTVTCNANGQIDSANCGSCGHSCGTADCSDGLCYAEPVLVPKPTIGEATLSGFNQRTFFSAGNLYSWEKVDDSSLNPELRYRLLRTPAAPATLPTAGSIVQDIPNDGSAPYFVDAVNYDATYLYQCTTTGGTRVALSASNAAPTVIFKAPVAAIDCNDIAISPTALFISSHDVVEGKDTLYTLPLASLGPAAVPTIVPNIGARDADIFSLIVVGSNLYWMEHDLALTATPPVLVTAPAAGLPSGGKPTQIDTDLGSESASIATDGSYLYWTDTHGAIGAVRRTKLPYVAGAKPEQLLKDVDGINAGIVMDANYLYVMESNNPIGNVVYRVAKDGSTSDMLGIAFVNDSAQHKGTKMTGVDANYVYFLLFDGIIGRLRNKP